MVPNAAYRHFAGRQALLDAVRIVALDQLALAMEQQMAVAAQVAEPADRARALLRAVGVAYVGFAESQPGLFRTAFSGTAAPAAPVTEPVDLPANGRDPLALLGSALDAMVAADVLPAARRPGAEYLAWSTVHGFAVFLLDGPLRSVTMGQRIFTGVVFGIGFVLLQKLLGPSSLVFGFPPLIAVMIPILLCIVLGIYLLSRAR